MKINSKKLEVGGIPAFVRPAFTDSLKFPVDVTQLTSLNLAELMGKYAALLAYVEQESTTWTIAEIRQEAVVEKEETRFIQHHPKLMFLDRWRLEVKLKQSSSVSLARRSLVTIRTLKERAQSLVRTYERLINVLSRELSRRLATQDGTRFAATSR